MKTKPLYLKRSASDLFLLLIRTAAVLFSGNDSKIRNKEHCGVLQVVGNIFVYSVVSFSFSCREKLENYAPEVFPGLDDFFLFEELNAFHTFRVIITQHSLSSIKTWAKPFTLTFVLALPKIACFL